MEVSLATILLLRLRNVNRNKKGRKEGPEAGRSQIFRFSPFVWSFVRFLLVFALRDF